VKQLETSSEEFAMSGLRRWIGRLASVRGGVVTGCLVGLVFVGLRWGLPDDGREVGPLGVYSECRHHVSQQKGDGLPPRAPNPWFHVQRAYPQGTIPLDRWREAQLMAQEMRTQAQRSRGGQAKTDWVSRGPTNVGGRITDLAVDPTDGYTVYAAAADGGVLRTENGGASWTPLFDEQAALAVGAVAIDPQNPQVIYAGTGEVNPGGGSTAYGGVGILRSSDGGDTWQPLGLENSGSIGRIVVDPLDGQRLFVAVMGHLWEGGPDRGVYRTTDGGATWERVLYVDATTGCVDLIQRPDNPDVVLAAMWQRIRQPEYYDYGGPGCAVYRTVDGGDSWSVVGGGLPAPSADGGRIGLSLCRTQSAVMHVVYADRVGYFDGLYRSTDGGLSWTQTNDGSLVNAFASYGWWFGNVRTHSTNANYIYLLGLEFYRSTNGGASYQNVSDIMHVDHHGMDFGPGLDPLIYNGNDGGVYRSQNGGSLWTKLYDLPITQVYRVGYDPSNPAALYGGTQDNSTVRTLSGDVDDWDVIYGGDGFQPIVHPASSNRIWAQYQYGVIGYSSNGGASFGNATSGISYSDRKNWNAPHVMDPVDPNTRYTGTQRVYRNTSNTSWTSISGDLTGGPHQGNSGQVDGTLTTLAVSPVDNGVLWSGSDDGKVHVFDGVSWLDVSDGLPQRWITAVRCDPHDRNTAFVTVSGFRWAEPLAHVFKTTDLGANWTPIAGNLPDVPVNDVVIDPEVADTYYVGTDVGVFATGDGGASWYALGGNLPRVVVTSLVLPPGSRVLIAGTYGRSFFSYDLGDPTPVGEDDRLAGLALGRVLPPYPNPTGGGTSIRWQANQDQAVTVEVFTVSGRRIWRHGPVVGQTASDAASQAAPASLFWDGTDSGGRPVPSGVYLVRVSTSGRSIGAKTVVVRR